MTDKDREDFLNKVFDYCLKYGITDFPAVVVGLSGGPDSVCLLTVLDEFKKTGRISSDIVAAHVNHNLRPGDCDDDEAFVKAFCEKLGIRCFVRSCDVAKTAEELGISVEEAGRRVRYSYFREVRESLDTEGAVIATAHHADDLTETMMMNLFRGSGLDGMTAMRPLNDGIMRPLLCVGKEEIREFLDASGISYVTDKTNFEEIGTRNIWRNKILPFIGDNISRDPADALLAAHRLLTSDSDYINTAVDEAYGEVLKTIGPFKAVGSSVRDLHEAVFTRVIRRLWKETFGNMTDFEAVNMREASDLILREDQEGFVTVDMPFGRKLWRFADLSGFMEEGEIEDLACALAGNAGYLTSREAVDIKLCEGFTGKIPGTSYIIKYTAVENADDLAYNIHSWICPADMPSLAGRSLHLRNDSGDLRFAKAGGTGSKLLKDVLADRKVPRPARRSVLAVTLEDDVLWLPGAGHATGFVDSLSRERFLEEGYKGRYLKVEIVPEE